MSVVIVTGAASGIGAATGALLAERGWTVVGVDREPCGGLKVDLADPDQVATVVPAALEQHGRVDALVNNAGLARHGAVLDLDLADVDLMWAVNVRAVMQLTRDAMRAMTEGGTVVNVVSTAGLRGEAGESAYCATKAAVRGFTEGAAEEGRAVGVRVTGVYPAGVQTAFWDGAVGDRSGFTGDKQWLTPSDVAREIVHVLETPQHVELHSVVVRHAGDTDVAGIRAKLEKVRR
jgi:NADP-dependent 3-hydroxy acid dehydrogenase YdfG